MKRFLVRAGFCPEKKYCPRDYITKNFVGGNTGNLFFAYGVMNVLKTADIEIEQTYKYRWTKEEAAFINEHYSAFILPLADGFRPDFIEYLDGFTELINTLSIPVYVIGVGLRAPYEPDFRNSFVFDEAVKQFVKAVLNHSSVVGLRGNITGHYLKKLGFREETDFTPIGCPSLYTYGDGIKIRGG